MTLANIQESIKALAGLLGKPELIELGPDHKVLVLQPGQAASDLKPFSPPPAYVKQRVVLLRVKDFTDYLLRFAVPAQTIVFANEGAAQFEAVLDYHQMLGDKAGTQRGECQHQALYVCPLSPQWKCWMDNNGKDLSQESFARFLESNFPDISTPPAAQLLQIALELQVHKSAKFDSSLNLANGQRQLKYMEDVRGTSKSGTLDIPTEFAITIPIFFGGKSYGLTARLRYRMNDGALTLSYELQRPHDAYQQAINEVTLEIIQLLGADWFVLRGMRG